MEQGAHSQLSGASSGPATPGIEPLITPVAGAPGKEETAARSPFGKWRGQRGLRADPVPMPSASQLETGGPWDTADHPGWKKKAEKIKGKT